MQSLRFRLFDKLEYPLSEAFKFMLIDMLLYYPFVI